MGKDAVGPAAVAVDEELIRDVARDVVERAAPGELAVFRRQSKAYFRDPAVEIKAARKSLHGKTKDEPLGFGAGEAVMVMAPFILAVVQGVLTSLASDLAVSAADRSQDGIRRLLRRVLRRPEPVADETPAVTEGPEAPLTTEQLARIHAVAHSAAVELGLAEDRAVRLADALVDALMA
ncbi:MULTISPECIES: hypothetical protein [unclassified Streptomyces]|uniref:hypothetical protein n=1 Tax=Streptomyces sp. NBC_00723 TaxID=2903673 RepID=UPI0038669500